MNIETHLIAWNEADTIHLTLKHYLAFSEVIVYDNHSTDDTRNIVRALGATVKLFGKKGELSDRAYMELKNECWKIKHNGKDRRDYVIVCDADEILSGYPTDTQYSVYDTIGRDVFSCDMPNESWFEIDNSHYQQNYSKNVIFDPKRIKESNYRIGAHVWSPRGELTVSPDKLFLFHYRNVGGPQRLVERHKLYRERLSEENKLKGFGVHYTWDDEIRIKEWEEKYSISKPLGIF